MSAQPYPRRPLPELALVSQKLAHDRIDDVRRETSRRLLDSGLLAALEPRKRIAITAGSRGMGGFVELVAGVADAIKSCGATPIVVPAMGSHGGATAEGQTEILRLLGVTSGSVGAEVCATMDVRALGVSDTGATAYLDAVAAQADGIIVLGRTQAHPENTRGIASGLLKMTTVGLGKELGAHAAHSHGLWPSVEAVPRVTLAKCNVVAGVAVVENAYREPAVIEVVPPSYEAFAEADRRLLNVSKRYAARLPFSRLDLLIVESMGKTVSGTGMDLNVIGPWRLQGGEREPDFARIVALSLTEASLGNALGVGLADFVSERLARAYDPRATYINLLAACEPNAHNGVEGALPLALPSDRDACEVALHASLASDLPRVCRIESTARLDRFWVSPALLPELADHDAFELVEPAKPIAYDLDGNFVSAPC